MHRELPSGSKIVVSVDGADTLIAVPHYSGVAIRFTGVMLAPILLSMWAIGLFFVARLLVWMLASGPPRGGMYVLMALVILWLAGWTAGGIRVMYSLYLLLRPSVPETLRLATQGVTYDSGVPPPSDRWRRPLAVRAPRRTRIEIDRRKLRSLRLRETNDGNRLTVDVDGQRLDIGKSASEIEREWLYQLLVKRYALTPAEGR